MNLRFNITIGILFILVGVLLGSEYIIQFSQNTSAQSTLKSPAPKSGDEPVSQPASVSLPTHISVPSVGVSVDIEPGYYNYTDNTWTLSDTNASFATVTSVPNVKSGNTYIYGHNKSNIFAELNQLVIGDEAIVTNSVGKVYAYKLVDIHDVSPDDLSFLNYQGKPILTLQTCTGFWDQYRRLFVFNLESEK